jgi:hypothetical protein
MLCRKEGIAQSMYYGWSKEFLEAWQLGHRGAMGGTPPRFGTRCRGDGCGSCSCRCGEVLRLRISVWLRLPVLQLRVPVQLRLCPVQHQLRPFQLQLRLQRLQL